MICSFCGLDWQAHKDISNKRRWAIKEEAYMNGRRPALTNLAYMITMEDCLELMQEKHPGFEVKLPEVFPVKEKPKRWWRW